MTPEMSREQLLDRCEALQWALDEINAPPPEYLRAMARVDVHLTKHEARFVATLMNRPDQPMTREALMAAIYWDQPIDDWPTVKNIDVFVCHLRAKLPDDGFSIETLWGEGYIGRFAKVTS